MWAGSARIEYARGRALGQTLDAASRKLQLRSVLVLAAAARSPWPGRSSRNAALAHAAPEQPHPPTPSRRARSCAYKVWA